jgi:hypothetical protein
MQQYYSELAAALRERIAVISNTEWRDHDPEQHLAALRTASEKIEELKARLPATADPMLQHYLQRMSLSKALELIEARGLC